MNKQITDVAIAFGIALVFTGYDFVLRTHVGEFDTTLAATASFGLLMGMAIAFLPANWTRPIAFTLIGFILAGLHGLKAWEAPSEQNVSYKNVIGGIGGYVTAAFLIAFALGAALITVTAAPALRRRRAARKGTGSVTSSWTGGGKG